MAAVVGQFGGAKGLEIFLRESRVDWMQLGIDVIERGWSPDWLTRRAIRRLCEQRLEMIAAQGPQSASQLSAWQAGPIAVETAAANEQHYELPPEFFALVLGPRRKYSCCYFPQPDTRLDQAEDAALALTCERAELRDGQRVLELGCGWGSLSLWMAECYPQSRIVAISNSVSQREFIESEARRRRLINLQVLTADVNQFDWSCADFDRVVSVEMLEHVRNHRRLLRRIARWLRPDGKLFVHVFCHRTTSYPFAAEGAANWMGRYFFTGGMMPSADLLTQFDDLFHVAEQHSWNGQHYQRTAEAWLANLRNHRAQLLPILADVYGRQQARRWYQRWRMFFLAVSELFGYGRGTEWYVSHYLMELAERAAAPVISNRKASVAPVRT